MSWVCNFLNWIFKNLSFSTIVAGVIAGVIANYLYEKRVKKFLNEIEKKISNLSNLPDELHRKALLKDFVEGNIPKVINNDPIDLSKKYNEMKNCERPTFSKDLRNKITTGNPANESIIWKIRNWFRNLDKRK